MECAFDISVVLNCHDERDFLVKTLNSLSESIKVAQKKGLGIELVIVIDSERQNIGQIINNYKFPDKLSYRVLHVSNASLGLSRNDGIFLAKGEFICTADADDLISQNWLLQCHKVASEYYKTYSKHAVVVSEYIHCFGNKNSIQKYYPSSFFSPCDYIAFHPFCSRIFAHNSIFRKIKYRDLKKSSGFAFEDWDFNVRTYNLNIETIVATDTILFYRKRESSIMAQKDYVHLIPHSELFEPAVFMKRYEAYQRPKDLDKSAAFRYKDFKKSEVLSLMTSLAHEIEPAIFMGNQEFTKNLDIIWNHNGYFFPKIFQQTAVQQFEDVFIFTEDTIGEFFLFAKTLSKNIEKIDPQRKTLFISVRKENLPNYIRREGFFVLELYPFYGQITDQYKIEFLCRVLLSLSAPNANLYLDTEDFLRFQQYHATLESRYFLYEFDAEFVKLDFLNSENIQNKFRVSRSNLSGRERQRILEEKTKLIALVEASVNKIKIKRSAIMYMANILVKFPNIYQFAKKVYRQPTLQQYIFKFFLKDF